MKIIYAFLFLLTAGGLFSQEYIHGNIRDENNHPVSQAEIYWFDTEDIVLSDENGHFMIQKIPETTSLVINKPGFETLLYSTGDDNMLEVKLVAEDVNVLDEVQVSSTNQALRREASAVNSIRMTQSELLKAACCNLAESFETNPAIDVNFTDAVTGNKQIKMLGLTSPYILIAEENIPTVRGASQAYGLSFLPGTWAESILVTKGAGPVANGYESISGQINTELIKPAHDIPLFVNVYGSTDARFELNTHINKKFSDKWSSTLFLHGNTRVGRNDMNDDGYLDNPLSKQINIMNRWQYQDAEKGLIGFFTARYMHDDKFGGEYDINRDEHYMSNDMWGYEMITDRVDLSSKIGYVFPEMPFQSIGLQTAFSYHKQDSYFGTSVYDIQHQSFYSNLLFNSIIGNTMNKFSTGLSFTWDRYRETTEFRDLQSHNRIDNSAGGFFEYTYDNLDNFSFIAGGRLDYHNRMGAFLTPRLHLRYNPWQNTTVKASFGKGKRLANIYAENQNLFASSRIFRVIEGDGSTYGLDPETAWNYGISLSQKFSLFNRKADLTVDFYRTDFQNQIVVDIDYSAREVVFYNLDGESFANSLQVDFNYNPFTHFNVRASYKYFDIQTDYLTGRFQKALQARHRYFTNLEYQTHEKNGRFWRFDLTYNLIGKQRLPYTADNLPENQLSGYAKAYSLVNTQVTRIFSSRFEVYIGVENLGNYQQKHAVLGADDPFGTNFDSSIIYAPVFGRMYYAGLRFKVF